LKNYPPKPDSYDTPILSPGDIHAAHLIIIGKIFASREVFLSEESTIPGVIKMLKEKSRSLGADAMVNVELVRKYDMSIGSYVISGTADAVVIERPKGSVEEDMPRVIKPKEYQL